LEETMAVVIGVWHRMSFFPYESCLQSTRTNISDAETRTQGQATIFSEDALEPAAAFEDEVEC
jgi:hypothetical protein